MGNQIRVPRTETEVPINLTVTQGGSGPVSGATALYAIRDGDTPDSWLDFNDSTFKTAGWTTRQASLTGSGTQAGLYTAVPGLDLTAITNLPAATDHLIVEYEVTAPAAVAGIASDIVLLDAQVSGVPTAVWSLTGLEVVGTFPLTTAGGFLATIEARMRNRVDTDPAAGNYVIYEADSSTPRITGLLFEDQPATQAYRGRGAERQNRGT